MTKPFWFERALAAPSEPGDVRVANANIHYRTWGNVGKPGLVLIHGSNAHLEWWRFVAPFLADQFRVAALDSSGNGNSDWRERYEAGVLAEEVWAVCDAAGLGASPFVVGHSFGGFVALETAHRYGDALGGVLFVDYTTAPPEQNVEWGLRVEREGVEPKRKLRTYPDRDAALERFRLIPEQPDRYPDVTRYIAEQSLKPVEGGWTWKFDPGLFDYLEMGVDQRDKFARLACRSAVLLGEDSDDEGAFFADHMAQITAGTLPIFHIPGTHHHLMFEEPLAVAAALKGIVLSWIAEDGRPAMHRALASALTKLQANHLQPEGHHPQ